MNEKIGIYGGTFDPVHHGHLILARDAVELLRLDRLIFIPAAISPHKVMRYPAASGAVRLAMLTAALADETRFAVDDCELRRTGPSYTIETIEALRPGLPAQSKCFYLIGEDNVPELSTWHRIAELRQMVQFVVFRRGTSELTWQGVQDFPTLPRRVEISATEIRKRVASGQSIRYLVPEAVGACIEAQGLYRPSEPGA